MSDQNRPAVPPMYVKGTVGQMVLDVPFWSYTIATNYMGMVERAAQARGKWITSINIALIETRGSQINDDWHTLRSISAHPAANS